MAVQLATLMNYTTSGGSGLQQYTDNFESYSAANLAGQGDWVTCLNTISIIDVTGNKKVTSDTAADESCVKLSTSWSNDHNVQITVGALYATDDHSIEVAARCSGSGATANYYAFYTYANDAIHVITLGVVLNGSWTTIARDETQDAGVGGILKIEVNGTSIKCYLNGSILTTLGDSATARLTGTAGEYTIVTDIAAGVPGISGYKAPGGTYADSFEANEV